MSFNRDDLKDFFRMGYISGFSDTSDKLPTVEEINDSFDAAYKPWREANRKRQTLDLRFARPLEFEGEK